MSKKTYILLSVFVFSVLITLLDIFFDLNYFVRMPIKIIFFLILPLLFFVKNKNSFQDFKKLFIFKKKSFLKSLLLGIGIYTIILGGYFLTKGVIDYSNITTSLTKDWGVNSHNFIYIALYISFINSFLEEFFFRGYGFITLKKYISRTKAYICSSLLFSIYHIGMLIGLFNFGILLLLLLGLFVGGCIFNYLNEMSGNIYSSWFVHMFANFAINTIGFLLFLIV